MRVWRRYSAALFGLVLVVAPHARGSSPDAIREAAVRLVEEGEYRKAARLLEAIRVADPAEPAQRASAVSGNAAPIVSAPDEIDAVSGTGVMLSAEVSDTDFVDNVVGTAVLSIPGLSVESVSLSPSRAVVTITGALPANLTPGDYTITWSGSDGVNPPVQRTTTIRVAHPVRERDTEAELMQFIKQQYVHGIPENRARELGPGATEMLYRLLRDEQHKRDWCNITSTLAIIATPATFDTLRDFIWTRFEGEVDRQTFQAILCAHTTIWNVASTRPEVVDYLERTANPTEWTKVRWHRRYGNMNSLAISLSAVSIGGLSCITTPRAIQVLETMRLSPFVPQHVPDVEEGIERQSMILRTGRDAQWRDAWRRIEGR